jgi:hypothetical protein
MALQDNLHLSHVPTTGPRRSSRLNSTPIPLQSLPMTRKRMKKQEQGDPTNVCSSVCIVIIVAHDDTVKVMQSTDLTPPPPLPIRGFNVPQPRLKEKGKGKEVIDGQEEAGGSDEDDDPNDENVDDPSFKDKHDLSAQFIVQQAS